MQKEATKESSKGALPWAEGRGGRRYLKLLPLGDARDRLASDFEAVRTELVDVDNSLGRVCASTVRSKKDIPERTTSAMDGYAIRSEDTKNASLPAPRRLRIPKSSDQPNSHVVVRRGEAVPVSTGDELPIGSDAVVRMEQTRPEEEGVLVFAEVPKWKNVSFAAEDVRKGQVLLRGGDIVTPAAVAVLISAGVVRLKARRIPRVGIVSVGKGLTGFREASPGRTINNFANLLLGYLTELKVEAALVGIGGDASETSSLIERAVRDYDIVLTIGSVSVGPGDQVPDAILRGADSKIIFHGLRAVPLRPAGLASVRGKPLVMLPGHAVSAALSFFVLGLPVLNIVSGIHPDSRRAVLGATAAEEFSNGRAIDAFVLATLKRRGGAYHAAPLGWGSNLQFNLALANGFVHLGPGEKIPPGQGVEVELLGASQLLRIAG